MSRIMPLDSASVMVAFPPPREMENVTMIFAVGVRQGQNRSTRTARITIMLSEETEDQMRRLANARGIGVATMVRPWLEERLAQELLTLNG